MNLPYAGDEATRDYDALVRTPALTSQEKQQKTNDERTSIDIQRNVELE